MFQKNKLSQSSSPYLRQHKDNPIHWQEFSEEVLGYAKQTGKPLFISIGYATCHWCHVMAGDTFSNQEIATFMNQNFVNIKVDREQRPDIDTYCMSFIQQHYGQGGWPLNVVLSPDLKPFFGATYIASTSKYGRPDFLTVMMQVLDFYNENKDKLSPFTAESTISKPLDNPDLSMYVQQIDEENGGFKSNQKFPPHCSLQYLMSDPNARENKASSDFCFNTLKIMQNSGLHDHVGGGFFRYCVDPQWKVPHFEKMLYDQAMMLINYSLGYAIYGEESFKETIERLLFCLEDTFRIGDLYVSGHDADTNHEEGTTYLWTKKQLEDFFGKNIDDFLNEYEMIEFENSNHLRKIGSSTKAYELYDLRKKRDQPFVDTKILTSWNALLGVAFCFVEKYVGIKTPVRKLYTALLKQKNNHSTNGNQVQSDYFLEDASSILLLQTFVAELMDIKIQDLENQFNELSQFLIEGTWIENPDSDFLQIAPQEFDHPSPSSASILQWAKVRYAILTDTEIPETFFKGPINFDAYNNVALFAREHHHIKAEEIPRDVPILNIFQSSSANTICFHGSCVPLL